MPAVSLLEVLDNSCNGYMAILLIFTGYESQDGKVILIRLGPSRVELVYKQDGD